MEVIVPNGSISTLSMRIDRHVLKHADYYNGQIRPSTIDKNSHELRSPPAGSAARAPYFRTRIVAIRFLAVYHETFGS